MGLTDIYRTGVGRSTARVIAALLVNIGLSALRSFAEDVEDSTVTAPAIERPKIGLVFGGGGALGFSHVGVLKVLEQNRVPIDYIAGTSMGAIVAGLYASGLSPEEIEHFLESVDWWDILKDKTKRRMRHFRRKRDDARYLMDIELGLKGARLTAPSGLSSGQKLNNVMQSLCINAVGVYDFDDLNIPFRAIGTDIKRGDQVILDHGNLATAMRASMAVPGAFTPVEIDGRLLVDGGIVNNIPVDVVKGMGADIVIVVDVGAWQEDLDKEGIDTVSEILGQTYMIMRRPLQRAQVAMATVVIEPDLAGFSAGTFHQAAGIIRRGFLAADKQTSELKPYSVSQEDYDGYLEKHRKKNTGTIGISSVTVEGNSVVDTRRIMSKIGTEPGDELDTRVLNRDIGYIYGFGDFQSVSYQLKPDNGDYQLRLLCKEKAWGPGYLRFGLRLNSDLSGDATWKALINYTRLSINELGGEVSIDIEGGTDRAMGIEWYQPMDYSGLTFIAPRLRLSNDLQGLYEDENRIAEYEVERLEAGLDLGVQLGTYAEFRIGPVWQSVAAQAEIGSADLPKVDDEFGGWRSSVILDRLDKVVFVREGYYLSVRGMMATRDLGAEESFETLSLAYRFYASHANHTAIVMARAGTSLGDELPQHSKFLLGGFSSLMGLAEGQLRGDHYGTVSLGYRYRLAKMPPSLGEGVYATIRIDGGNAWQEGEDIEASDALYGGGIVLGAETAMGPIYLGYGYAEGGNSRFYFSVGSLF